MSEGICAFCVFTNGSNAKGCTITLSNDLMTYDFNISQQSIAVLECFTLPQSGTYHILVSEVLMDGSEGYNTLELPDITIESTSGSDTFENGTRPFFE